MSSREALDRTIRITRDLIGRGVAEQDVHRALNGTCVAIVADATNIESAGAQTLIVTLAAQLFGMGMAVRLEFPETALVGRQPPLEGPFLRAGLLEFATDHVPDLDVRADAASKADVTFAIGSSACGDPDGYRVTATGWLGEILLAQQFAPAVTTALPFGPGIVACLCAAEALKHAVRGLCSELGLTLPVGVSACRTALFSFGVEMPMPSKLAVGAVDFISGGAISSACLHALLRVPGLSGHFRVIEPDVFSLSNLNRYPLGRRSHIDIAKATTLEQFQSDLITIRGVTARFDEESLPQLRPLAPFVVVGADSLPARWLAQREHPRWLGVGATAEFLAIASEHESGEACAGCVHPKDDGINGAVIPTISFVSYAAGLAVAAKLVRHAISALRSEQVLELWALGLGRENGASRYEAQLNAACPVCASVHRHRPDAIA